MLKKGHNTKEKSLRKFRVIIKTIKYLFFFFSKIRLFLTV